MNLDQQDQDPPNFCKEVNKKVTLDMLSDQELVDELIKRERLIVVTATRSYPIELHDRPNFMLAVNNKLGLDTGEYLTKNQMIAVEENFNYKTRYMEYSAVTVVLSLLPEERPI